MGCIALQGIRGVKTMWGRDGIDKGSSGQSYPYNTKEQCDDCLKLDRLKSRYTNTNDMPVSQREELLELRKKCNC